MALVGKADIEVESAIGAMTGALRTGAEPAFHIDGFDMSGELGCVLAAERLAVGHKREEPTQYAADAVAFAKWATPQDPTNAGRDFENLAKELLRNSLCLTI